MDHFSHEHPLILNEVYIAKSGDVCCGCREEIVSCRSFIYSCSRSSNYSTSSSSTIDDECVKFLLHKSCAELPPTIGSTLKLYSSQTLNDLYGRLFRCWNCKYRWSSWPSGFIYICSIDKTHDPLCAICAMEFLERHKEDRICIYEQHPAHPQHTLKFVDHLSSFKCYACKVDDNIKDLSYICTKCPFWIHKSCADAPASFQFQFHDKHPLQLSLSLPQRYQTFPEYCRFCSKQLYRSDNASSRGDWVYYRPKCRFFAHFHCARSNEKIRLIEDEIYDSEVVHLPAADESSADQLAEQFVLALSTTTTITTTNNCFRHRAHKKHDLQLMTINELNINQKHDDEALLLLLCDACVKPIRTDHDHQDNQFYGCVPCNYFMHKACAGLPGEIEHHLHPGIPLHADQYISPLIYFRCFGCGVRTNGMFFEDGVGADGNRVHIGCLTLPKKIKHEAHNHQLDQVISTEEPYQYCKACRGWGRYKYCCEKCGYYICARCIMKPKTVKHRWDPHPLSLIYDPGMVSSDHEHAFECEYCSKEIDTNRWFYHCSECDLSFHYYCFLRSSNLLKLKV